MEGAFNTFLDFLQQSIQEAGVDASPEVVIYLTLLEVSVFLTILYAIRWQRNFSVYYSLIFTMLPLSILGRLIISMAETAEEAMVGQIIFYLGGCFLIFFVTMAIFELCNIYIAKWVKILMLYFNIELYLSIVVNRYTHVFYTEYHLVKTDTGVELVREYGIMHTVMMVVLIAYYLVGFISLIYAFFCKKNVSKKQLVKLFFVESLCVVGFFMSKQSELFGMIDWLPVLYIVSQVLLLFLVRRLSLFNIRDTAMDTIAGHSEEGFISFDKKLRYIGHFGSAVNVFPELARIRVDRKAEKYPFFRAQLLPMIIEYRETGHTNDLFVDRGQKIFRVEVHTLYNGRKRAGYQLHVTDDTMDRIQIDELDKRNDHLREKVEQKNLRIREMNDHLLLSMATMVESRDNSTGGHIRRTSDVVGMLIEEIKKDNVFGLTDKFCRDVIKAAPMHDLGKIAVPDAILQKPGRFTDEEFEIMKTHAAEGARIVREILESTDDTSFKTVAENVAHYHHERMDGSGYPDHLAGEQIPMEARIMAVADVYDALVSKRVYKESMSFEKADAIIMDSFGKHFDPQLERYYLAAKPRLEEYYSREENA